MILESFGDELIKLGSRREAAKKLLERIKKHPRSGPMARATALGAGVTTAQEAIGSDDPRLLRAALAGAAGGAITGAAFPGWFARSNMAKSVRKKG